MLTLSWVLALLQTDSSKVPLTRPMVWQFSMGQEFFVDENHRQLYLVKNGAAQLQSYIDYSLLARYRVKSVQGRFVELEATWEKVRINNPNEAGKEAIEVLKKKEGTKHTYSLRRQNGVWRPVRDSADQESVFSTLLFALGTASFDAEHSAWSARWPLATPSGKFDLVLKVQTRLTENPVRLRSEVRGEFELSPPEGTTASALQLENVASATPGLGFFDTKRGRWDYLDFRVISILKTTEGARKIEIKQDFTAAYRISDNRPFWPEK